MVYQKQVYKDILYKYNMPKPYRVVKCRNCNYEWIPRVLSPIECPHCRVRSPTQNKIKYFPGEPNAQEEQPIINIREPITNKKVVKLE